MPPNEAVVSDSLLQRMSEGEIYQLHNLFPHQLWDYGKMSYTLRNCGSNCTYSHGGKDEALLNYVRQRRGNLPRQGGKTSLLNAMQQAANQKIDGSAYQPNQ